MITSGAVFVPLLHHHRRVVTRHAQPRDFAGALGLRPVQIWVPDVRSPEFADAAHAQSIAIGTSEADALDQAFVDAISWDWGHHGPARVNRGDVYTAAARGPHTGKPRPVVIVQDDRFDATASVTVCPLTTNVVDAPLLRIPLGPTPGNGLDRPSSLMVDKITTMPRANLVDRLGRLADEDMLRLGRAVVVFFGLA